MRAGIARTDFRNEMEAEHCKRACSTDEFSTSNYGIRTTPYKEWHLVVTSQAAEADTDLRFVPVLLAAIVFCSASQSDVHTHTNKR